MFDIFINLEFKHYAVLALFGYAFWLFRMRRPSLYGGVFSLFCIYLPLYRKLPFAILPGINGMNIFYLIMLFLTWKGKINLYTREFDCVWKYGLLWIGILSLSTLFSMIFYYDSFNDPLVQLKRWIDPIIIYYFARGLSSEVDRAAATDGIIAGLGLFSLHLSLQGLDMGDRIRLGGALEDINAAAAFIAAYSAIFVVLIAHAHSSILSLFLFIALLFVCIFAEFQTVSRSGIIGMVLAFLIAGIFSKKFFIIACMAILIGLSFFSTLLLPPKILSRFEGKSMTSQIDNEAQISSDARFEIWSAATNIISANPLGIGMARFKKEIGNYGGPSRRDAHNAYLLIAAENGLPGLTVFLFLIWHLLKRGWNGMEIVKDKYSQIAGLTLFSAILALLVMNFFSVTIRDTSVFGYSMVFAGIVGNKRQSLR
jgi:O-antigen ligase